MKDIEIKSEPLDKRNADFDIVKFVQEYVYAFAGKTEEIIFHCDANILDDIIDKFGTDIKITDLHDGELEVAVKATEKGIKFWLLQYLPSVEVVSPESLRDEITKLIANNRYTK